MTQKPKSQIKKWINEAEGKVEGNWNAMCVSTIDEEGIPDSRMVLFKQFSKNDNLIFFTNYQSKKSNDLLGNDLVSVNFFWDKFSLIC